VDTPKRAKLREECSMAPRKRRVFTPEFKADAVRLCRTGDRSIGQVAKDMDLGETALRAWLARAESERDVRREPTPTQTLTTAERSELEELRKRVKRLEMEREILKKAAAFFAKENG
jgi:transposase-like protein